MRTHWLSLAHLVATTVVTAVLIGTGTVGCASAPGMRPATPLPEGKMVEVGANVGGAGGIDRWGGIGGAFGRVTFFETIDVVGNVHGGATLGGQYFPDAQPIAQTLGNTGLGYGGYVFGGSLGVRGRYPVIKDTLLLGIGGHVDYLQQSFYGKDVRHLSGVVTMPVSERLYGPVWVNVRPTIGIALPLYSGAEFPVQGIFEMPLGVSWQVNEHFSLMTEGGYHLPTNGGYLVVGASMTL